jgi:hypothetical protein
MGPRVRGDDERHSRDSISPEFYKIVRASKEKRAQGKPGARCTHGLMCMVDVEKLHMSIQVQRKHSGLPRAMV